MIETQPLDGASIVTPPDAAEIIDLIDLEAELADSHRLEEWLALWNPQRAAYVVPTGAIAGARWEVSIIRDDYARICERIRRLRSGSAHAQDPPSSLSRVVGRPRCEPADDGAVRATARFMCVEVRPDRESVWAGRTTYTVARRADGHGLELWRKEVHLVNAHREIPTLGFLI